VDLDPQYNATSGIGTDLPTDGTAVTIYDVLLSPKTDVLQSIRPTSVPGLDIIPSSLALAGAEIQLPQQVGAEKLLREALERITDGYDIVLIDCPPSLNRLTLNALTAATHVLVPVAATGKWPLEGTGQLLDTLELVRSRLNPDIRLLGIVCTFYDARTTLSEQVLAKLRDQFDGALFNTVIKTATKVGEASIADKPVLRYASSSAIAEAFRALAAEMEARL
jgi:chromosome partitioning protein